MASILLAIVAERAYERWDFHAVDVVPAALSLRFQNVVSSLVCISGNANGVFPLWRVIKGVNCCKCGADAVNVGSGRSR